MGVETAVMVSSDSTARAETGLTLSEVDVRRRNGHDNTFHAQTGRSYSRIIWENLFTFINIVLFTVGGVLIFLGRVDDALVSVGVVAFNLIIGLVQEIRAKQTLDRIGRTVRPRISVRFWHSSTPMYPTAWLYTSRKRRTKCNNFLPCCFLAFIQNRPLLFTLISLVLHIFKTAQRLFVFRYIENTCRFFKKPTLSGFRAAQNTPYPAWDIAF